MIYLLISAGAVIGAVLRQLVNVWLVPQHPEASFPTHTFAINLAGSLIIGMVAGFLPTTSNARYFFATGFCGAFTTFSAFSLEMVALFKAGEIATALIYAGLSLLLGPALAWAGFLIADRP